MSMESKVDVLLERTETMQSDLTTIKEDVKGNMAELGHTNERVAKVEAKTKYQWALLLPILLALLGLGWKSLF